MGKFKNRWEVQPITKSEQGSNEYTQRDLKLFSWRLRLSNAVFVCFCVVS